MGNHLNQCWFVGKPNVAYHSGDLGDIIYSLLFLKNIGKLQLHIGPSDRYRLRENMSYGKFQWLAPLLQRQPWIESVSWSDGPPWFLHYNLNDFRDLWFSAAYAHKGDKQLWDVYREHFGGPELCQDQAWLEADPAYDSNHPVIINRSFRWRNDAFPWRMIATKYFGKMAFVGLHDEFLDWTRQFGKSAEYRPVVDALDLANIIAGAELFIGNQSLPMAIALGLNKPLIQETCQGQPDCILKRPNAQFTFRSFNIQLPEIKPHRVVSLQPGRSGLIELGPCSGAPGIGDTLMLLPVARALSGKAVMLLPSHLMKYAFMFYNVCKVVESDEYPVFPWPGPMQQSAGHLARLGLNGVDPTPAIENREEARKRAESTLEGIKNPLAFCPTCSRHWVTTRQAGPEFWQPVIESLKQRFTVMQFGLPDYPLVEGAIRAPYLSIEHLAAVYQRIGVYVGVNTGDYHLMVAVGGKVVVANPNPWNEEAAWNYRLPGRAAYARITDNRTVLNAIAQLPL